MKANKPKAPKLAIVSFSVDEKIVEKVNKKYKTFEQRKAVQSSLRQHYQTLLKNKL